MLQFWRGMREGGAGKAKERADDGRDVARGRGGLCGCQIVRRGVLWKGRIVLIFWELFWRKMERSVAAVRVVGRNVSEPVLDDQGAPFDRERGLRAKFCQENIAERNAGARSGPNRSQNRHMWRGIRRTGRRDGTFLQNPETVKASQGCWS